MNIITKQQRFKQLHLALQYCTDMGGVFSIWERIMINQERGNLLRYTDPNDFLNNPAPEFEHIHLPGLRTKIDFTIEKIEKTRWIPKPRLLSKYGA